MVDTVHNERTKRMNPSLDRRSFLKVATALSALALWPAGCASLMPGTTSLSAPRAKKPARVRGAFFYPPAEVVLRGEFEDGWAEYKWSTWPGNQFKPEEQQAKFMDHINGMAGGLDLTLSIDKAPIYTKAGIQAFIREVEATKPDALLLINFWNTMSAKLGPILDAFDGPIILYHPVGANHQLPPAKFQTAPRVQYIHSIENWDAMERGLRSVHAQTRMAQSRLLRVSGQVNSESDAVEPFFGAAIHSVPADHFNNLFDETGLTPDLERLARSVRRRARRVSDLSDQAFLDAVRSHGAVLKLMEHHQADAITIECLLLKHRKPCLSFALNNGALVPCGCENDLNATLSLMLGANLFGRGGFQHNPDFDTENNLYYASHCTCATKLHGPQGKDAPYMLRPFFHMPPKTLALDTQWPAGEPVTQFKYLSGEKRLNAWSGVVLDSPTCPPVGGCATRVLVRIDKVDDVRAIYSGPHPILYCGNFARQAKVYAHLYGLDIRTNA